jgi:flagellar motor switch protein FliG
VSLENSEIPTNVPTPVARVGRRGALTRRQKAAVIVRLLVNEDMQPDLARLTEAQQTSLTRDIATLRRVDKDTLSAVLGEFVAEIEGIALSFPADLGGALEQLEGFISEHAAAKLRRESGLSYAGDPWDRLSALGTEKLLPVLVNEPPEIAAVIISKLKVGRAADILGQIPGPVARRITFAISRTATIDPDTVQAIGGALLESLDAEPIAAFPEGPVTRIGALLNTTTAAIRDDMLDGLDSEDKDFAREVRKAIFTFANIPERIEPRDIPRILRDLEDDTVVKALALAQIQFPAAAKYFLESLSTRMADQLRESIQDAGTPVAADGERAMSRIVGRIREMERGGELILMNGER